MTRRGFALMEILVILALAATMLLPVLNLSSRNVEDHQDMLERQLAQGLCLDMLERFKRYKPIWPLPGSSRKQAGGAEPPPIEELFGPVETNLADMSLFDKAYLEQLHALGISPKPHIERLVDPRRPGFFLLKVTVSWKSLKGFSRQVSSSRYCFAP